MRVHERHYRTIWLHPGNPRIVQIIDQRHLPFEFIVRDIPDSAAMADAIREMQVRGAGLIGAAAGYGIYLAAMELSGIASADAFTQSLTEAGARLKATRPTAVNLEWAVQRQLSALAGLPSIDAKIAAARLTAQAIADEDAEHCRLIGEHGVKLIAEIHGRTQKPVNILTHCNAGWLAFVDHGSATAPIYAAHDAGIPVHVWVDETRPRNQGARLTAWELSQHGVPHTVIADNAGGHLMQHGQVDIVITGADRVTYTGDAANKIGTYLKALAARDNRVPFYVALPSSTFDWEKRDGVSEIPIEERGGDEVSFISGMDSDGVVREVRLTPLESRAANFGFDVTPARLITGLITERGVCAAREEAVFTLFSERRPAAGSPRPAAMRKALALHGAATASGASARPLDGRIALVTGAASGIGKACAEALREQGALVAMVDIAEEVLQFASPDAFPVVCDVNDSKAVDAAVRAVAARFGGLDVLVSNAGNFPPSSPLEAMDPAVWQASLDLNLTSHLHLLQACFPFLKEGVEPSVVLIASKNVPAPGPGAAAYSSAKAGLTQLGRVAALEWGKYGIRVNMLHPNAVFDTGLWSPEILQARAKHYGVSVDEYKRSNVLKAEVTARDVALAACALAGKSFAKTTGAQIPVDGGNERVI